MGRHFVFVCTWGVVKIEVGSSRKKAWKNCGCEKEFGEKSMALSPLPISEPMFCLSRSPPQHQEVRAQSRKRNVCKFEVY